MGEERREKRERERERERERDTHVDADDHKVVGVEEVEGDWLGQVEGQLDVVEGDAGVGGGEDDPAGVVHHRRVRRQDHLQHKNENFMGNV